MRFCLLALLLLCPLSTAVAQESSTGEIIPLWENGAPGFENRKDEPEKAESYWVKISTTLPSQRSFQKRTRLRVRQLSSIQAADIAN